MRGVMKMLLLPTASFVALSCAGLPSVRGGESTPGEGVVVAAVVWSAGSMDPAQVILDTATFRAVVGLDQAAVDRLTKRLSAHATPGSPSADAACRARVEGACIRVAVRSYYLEGRFATVRVVQAGIVPPGRCAGSYEATLRMRLENGTAIIVDTLEQAAGDCGRAHDLRRTTP